MWIFSEKPFNGQFDWIVPPMDWVCTCLYYNIVNDAVRLPTYISADRPNSTARNCHEVVCTCEQATDVRVIPSTGAAGWFLRVVYTRTHSHTTVTIEHTDTRSHTCTRTLSCPPASCSENTHTHTHTSVCARRKTRTKFDDDDVDARALSESWRFDVSLTNACRTGWGTAEETKLENCRRENAVADYRVSS